MGKFSAVGKKSSLSLLKSTYLVNVIPNKIPMNFLFLTWKFDPKVALGEMHGETGISKKKTNLRKTCHIRF